MAVKKVQKLLLAILSVGMTLLLTGCNMVVLNPKGPIAEHEKHLFILALCLILIVVIPVLILTVIISIRYRASSKKAKYDPSFTHSTKLELFWWLIPIIIIAILAVVTWRTTHELDPYKPLDGKALGSKAKPVVIQAISLRWKWLFIYPQYGIATVNYVKLPVKTPINFYITSDAPMNSFQIQQLGGQIYAMNGMQTKLHLFADGEGTYRCRSVSYSGSGFAGMRCFAQSVATQDFNAWVAKVKKSPKVLDMKTYKALAEPSENNPPVFYSSVESGLFQKVINSFMAPEGDSKAVKDAKPISL